jgi:hypothetical protein
MARRKEQLELDTYRAGDRSGVVAVALLLVGLILLRSKGAHSLDSQRCPIDGMAAEWRSDGRGTNICNYGHFSVVERQAHTWWGACR